jgi:hypothetical protein
MYIRKASLKNIRSILELDWAVNEGEEAGWHVILGDNGSGKSSFLKALALGLVGPRNAEALRPDWTKWITRGKEGASIQLQVAWESADEFSGPGNVPKNRSLSAGLEIRSENGTIQVSGTPKSRLAFLERGIWGGAGGWFAASYGPFRRFTGGDAEFASISLSRPKLAAQLSLFGENFALTEAIRWLQELDYRRKDKKPEGKLLEGLIRFVNDSGLLPHETLLRGVSSDGVVFEDGNGFRVPVQELSDGYRSILSLTFELIRQLSQSYGWEKVFDRQSPRTVTLPGVVLIDEVDAHLHPAWQHRIGTWFLKFFPRLQFIVSTHSPIICQAAEKGSVWQLPEPGSEQVARRLEGTELGRLLYGNLLDAYGTGLFGEGVTRSETGKQRVRQLAELNIRSVEGELSEPERVLQEQLRASTPTAGAVALADES